MLVVSSNWENNAYTWNSHFQGYNLKENITWQMQSLFILHQKIEEYDFKRHAFYNYVILM